MCLTNHIRYRRRLQFYFNKHFSWLCVISSEHEVNSFFSNVFFFWFVCLFHCSNVMLTVYSFWMPSGLSTHTSTFFFQLTASAQIKRFFFCSNISREMRKFFIHETPFTTQQTILNFHFEMIAWYLHIFCVFIDYEKLLKWNNGTFCFW